MTERALGTVVSPSPSTLTEHPQLRMSSVAQPHKIPFPVVTRGQEGLTVEVRVKVK